MRTLSLTRSPHDEERGDSSTAHSKSSRKRKLIASKYHVLPPCSCKQRCIEKISEEKRKIIFQEFWSFNNFNERRNWIFGHIKQQEKMSSTVSEIRKIKTREYSRSYSFNVNNCSIKVCAVFWQHTLGYKHDTFVTSMFRSIDNSMIQPSKDKRGNHVPKHAKTNEHLSIIDEHIESFHPSISHYRRSHAPLRRYMAPELSPRIVFQYFRGSYPDVPCTEVTYRRRICLKNISFSKLGEEECEVCEAHLLHECDGGFVDGDISKKSGNSFDEIILRITPGVCEHCDVWLEHIKSAKLTRKEYRRNADTYPEKGVYCMSADMEKVIMLPRLPGVKTAVFTRRIVMYHETFAPLVPSKEVRQNWREDGKVPEKLKVLGMIWHEGVQGRCDEDVTSTVIKVLHHLQYRDAREIVIWADNCTGQLKNWTLYSALLLEVNNHENINKITVKYLVKGHTFMSADAFHSQVEKAMKVKKNL